ncbi:hypothetical protein MKW94_018304 [Papaver nudicaule]|uniref:Uncharacterized protein n=1 Tax=Papaver nudicaule TaxID=74823 RepID=A0AA41S4Z2_PAPNU|nr:hypothetical protein [Papaver nudicaule]
MEVVNKIDLENQANIWKIIYGFCESLVLKCAVQLEIAETIHNHGKPMSLSELASKLPVQPINSDRLYRIMRYLVHMKLFNMEISPKVTKKYSLAPPAKYLIRGWERSMVASILAMNDKDMLAPWHHLNEGLSGNCNAFEKALGKSIWVFMSENPEKNQLFNEAMACDTRLVTSALVNECKSVFCDGTKTLVDVGGGTGAAMMAVSEAFPNIKCTIFDLPHVIAESPEMPNITKVSGDMFVSIPSADAILMKNILHDWDDDKCIKILMRCKEALPREGKVIIVDIVLDVVDSVHPYTKVRLASDLDMMLNTGGRERTEEELKRLINAAGFTSYKVTQMSAVQSVIEAYP